MCTVASSTRARVRIPLGVFFASIHYELVTLRASAAVHARSPGALVVASHVESHVRKRLHHHHHPFFAPLALVFLDRIRHFQLALESSPAFFRTPTFLLWPEVTTRRASSRRFPAGDVSSSALLSCPLLPPLSSVYSRGSDSLKCADPPREWRKELTR